MSERMATRRCACMEIKRSSAARAEVGLLLYVSSIIEMLLERDETSDRLGMVAISSERAAAISSSVMPRVTATAAAAQAL